MKLVIDGNTYDIETAITQATLKNLLAMQRQSKTATGFEVSLVSIQEMWERVGKLLQDPKFDQRTLIKDADFMVNMAGVMFLARRKAGEELTFDQASDVTWNGYSIEPDDDEVVEEGPKDEAEESTSDSAT